MNTRDQIIAAAIAHCASPMGDYHAAGFTEACQRVMTQVDHLAITDQDKIVELVQTYASQYQASVKAERDRILAIDAIAAQLPPGYEVSARSAKFETLITADEFAVQVLQAERTFTHSVPGQHH